MAVYKDKNGTWYVSARYTNWKGEADRKLKRGFQTKKEATEWERNFFLENAGNLEMSFEAFYDLYKKNMQDRIKLSTWKIKESVIESKILPYFRKKRMCDIKPRDVVTWQNTMLKMRDDDGNPYSPVYLKTIHNQLSAIFNHAVKFYDLPNNPAQKAGNMGKEKSREMLFWTQEEYKAFAEAVMDKPISFYTFEVLYSDICSLLGDIITEAVHFSGYNEVTKENKEDNKMSAININRNNFQNEVMNSDRKVLLDFWAPWCGPCRMVVPIVEEIARERSDIKVGKINVDEQPELAIQFGVMSIPTLVVMENGKIIQQISGARPKNAILGML